MHFKGRTLIVCTQSQIAALHSQKHNYVSRLSAVYVLSLSAHIELMGENLRFESSYIAITFGQSDFILLRMSYVPWILGTDLQIP